MLLLVLCNCNGMDGVLKMYGYIPLTPPSKLLKPGAIIFKKKRDKFEVGIICTAEQSLGPNFRPIESETIPTFMERNLNKEIDISGEALDRVTAGAGSKATKSVSVVLKNAKLFEINDWIVATYISERSPVCERMIRERLAAGYTVTMVTSALVADAAYNIEWENGGHIDAAAKLLTMETLSGSLKGLSGSSSKNKFEAENLIWGVRTDNFLAAMSLSQN